MLVGASALAVMLLGRPGDAVTAGITTAVIMVVAAVSPQHAWQQPILRLADTVVGVAVGAMAAWTGIRVRRFLPAQSVPRDPAKVKVDLPERAVVRGPRPGRPHLKRDAPSPAAGSAVGGRSAPAAMAASRSQEACLSRSSRPDGTRLTSPRPEDDLGYLQI